MLEYLIIEKPTQGDNKKFSARFASEALKLATSEWRERVYNSYKYIAASNMIISHSSKLIVSGERSKYLRRFIPFGFMSYSAYDSSEFDDLGDVSNLFQWGDLKQSTEIVVSRVENKDILKMDPDLIHYISNRFEPGLPVGKSRLKELAPFNRYSRSRSLVSIHHIEVSGIHQREGIATNLINAMLSEENPEIIEGLAHPGSLGFWEKIGYEFPAMYSGELTAIVKYLE